MILASVFGSPHVFRAVFTNIYTIIPFVKRTRPHRVQIRPHVDDVTVVLLAIIVGLLCPLYTDGGTRPSLETMDTRQPRHWKRDEDHLRYQER